MQHILSIDASTDTVHAAVFEVSGNVAQVVESASVTVTDPFSIAHLLPQHRSGGNLAETDRTQEPPVSTDDGEANQQEAESAESLLQERQKAFESLLNRLRTPWTSAVLIIPSYDYLSLNLELPFADDKSIKRVLGLEVQDVIPFDVSEFLLQHSLITGGNGSNDVHVGLMPRIYVQRILAVCRTIGVEPVVVSTPSSALAAFYYLAPDFVAPNSMVVHLSDQFISTCVAVDGLVRADRVVRIDAGETDDLRYRTLVIAQLKLTLAAIEQRFNTHLDAVYLIGERLSASEIQVGLGRTTHELDPREFVRSQKDGLGLAGISSIFGQDFGAPPLLTNFRAGEFSYSPQLKELARGLRSLFPYLGITVGLIVVMFIMLFLAREYKISELESSMRAEIIKVKPDLASHHDDVIAALHGVRNDLVQHVEGLGSPSKFTPLGAFAHISEDLAEGKKRLAGVDYTDLLITTQKIVVDGRASEFSEVESLMKIFERKRKVYCRANKRKVTGQRGNISFSFELILCE